jgi:hypothetical protein
MSFRKYIAWLDGYSVAVGSLAEVRAKAREIWASELFQKYAKDCTVLKVTTYGRQSFVESITLRKGRDNV